MLILSRKEGEAITVDGPCTIYVTRIIRNEKVKLGIEAEPEVTILRSELEEKE